MLLLRARGAQTAVTLSKVAVSVPSANKHITNRPKKNKIVPIRRKPTISYSVDTDENEVILPDSIPGYTPGDMKKLRVFVSERLKGVSSLDLTTRASEVIKEAKNLKFIEDRGKRRQKSRMLRAKRMKKRTYTRALASKYNWHMHEDLKENRVLRERARTAREEHNEDFSLTAFLRLYRRRKQQDYDIVEDDEKYYHTLMKTMEDNLKKGPPRLNAPKRENPSFERRYNTEIWQPYFYELRRKALATYLVKQREEYIALRNYDEWAQQNRIEKALYKARVHEMKMKYWNEQLGQYYAERTKLKMLKNEYRLAQEETLSKSRGEFLRAMQEDINDWKKTPDEAKYMRFHFADGNSAFPYRNTPYA